MPENWTAVDARLARQSRKLSKHACREACATPAAHTTTYCRPPYRSLVGGKLFKPTHFGIT